MCGTSSGVPHTCIHFPLRLNGAPHASVGFRGRTLCILLPSRPLVLADVSCLSVVNKGHEQWHLKPKQYWIGVL